MIPFAEIDHVLIFFSIFLCITLSVTRTLSALKALGAFLLACVFILADGHFWLGEAILPEGRNPQIATVGLMVLTPMLMILFAAVRRLRSFDRIIMAFASLSVVVTSGLFHFVLIQQVLPAWAKDAAWGNSFLLSTHSAALDAECKAAGLSCWGLSELAAGGLPEAFKQQVEGVHRFYEANEPGGGEAGHGFGVFNDLGRDGVAVVLYHRNGHDVRVIADAKTGLRIHGMIRDLFYLLDTVAHGVWIGGALLLIAFHRRRFARRAANAG